MNGIVVPALVFGFLVLVVRGGEAPNILWITAEDMSPALGCYGDRYSRSPNIDALARESVRFTRAFATSPVCSPSRSTLITGCYATALGTVHLRSSFPIPDFITGFPSELRKQLGYYTTNNVKTDYNTSSAKKIIAASWDESGDTAHWRKRPDPDKPFFSIFNLMTSHQSRTMAWPYAEFVEEVQSKLEPAEIHDPAKAPIPPYYVDTPVVRKTVARFYDCVTVMDKEVGAILEELEEDGLADDTIVFFYSDHGSGMPRHKRCLLDSGMHVPLLVRFPEKFRHLAPAGAGETSERLVSFVDFGPTVLSLAGAKIPGYMHGTPFLGSMTGAPRRFVFGHRDRVDEVMDLARSVRNKRYLYIHNYMPHLGYNQPTAWPDQGEIRHEFYRLADRERMSGPQWHFAGPTRPVEELYDCVKDPQNLENLAGGEGYEAILAEMRKALLGHIKARPDLGFIPESVLWELCRGSTPWAAGVAMNPDRWAMAAEADDATVPFGGDMGKLLEDEFAAHRYWAASFLPSVFLPADEWTMEKRRAALERLLKDPSAAVRIESANSLARMGHLEKGLPVLIAALALDNQAAVLHAARAIELLGSEAKTAVPAMERLLTKVKTPPTRDPQGLTMFIRFSVRAFLDQVEDSGSEGVPPAP